MIDNKHQSHGQCQSVSLFLIFLNGNLYKKLATEWQNLVEQRSQHFHCYRKS